MSFHLMAFTRLREDAWRRGPLVPSPDQVVAFSETGNPLFAKDVQIVAGYAVGEILSRVLVDTPSLREGVKPYIVPLEIQGWDERHTTPNLMVLQPGPWRVAGQEEIVVNAVDVSGMQSMSSTVALLWFADRVEPVPAGQNYWVRYSAKFGLGGDTFPGWFPLKVKYEQRLAIGEYAVVGFEHRGNHIAAARLVFDDQVFRPGTLAVPLTSGQSRATRTHPAFLDGTFGVYGSFSSYAMPRIEVHLKEYPNGDAQEEHEGYLRVVRLR
jgi:hypothetical protein